MSSYYGGGRSVQQKRPLKRFPNMNCNQILVPSQASANSIRGS